MHSAANPSLYERLSGVYSIATVVDHHIDRVTSDPRLNANSPVDVYNKPARETMLCGKK